MFGVESNGVIIKDAIPARVVTSGVDNAAWRRPRPDTKSNFEKEVKYTS